MKSTKERIKELIEYYELELLDSKTDDENRRKYLAKIELLKNKLRNMDKKKHQYKICNIQLTKKEYEKKIKELSQESK